MQPSTVRLLSIASLAVVALGGLVPPKAEAAPSQRHGYVASSQGYQAGSGAIRMQVEPKEAQVFVDGYYAGIVDDFDGTFQKLYLQPGEHTIELKLEGYRSFTQKILISPSHTQKLHLQMVRLDEGAVNPPALEPPDRQAPQAQPTVRSPAPLPPSAPSTTVTAEAFGVLQLRVQPADGEIRIDGDPWGTLGGMEEISIHLPAGMHRIELDRAGTSVFSTDVEIRKGATTPVNIRLAP